VATLTASPLTSGFECETYVLTLFERPNSWSTVATATFGCEAKREAYNSRTSLEDPQCSLRPEDIARYYPLPVIKNPETSEREYQITDSYKRNRDSEKERAEKNWMGLR
jgi:hypothetical protein